METALRGRGDPNGLMCYECCIHTHTTNYPYTHTSQAKKALQLSVMFRQHCTEFKHMTELLSTTTVIDSCGLTPVSSSIDRFGGRKEQLPHLPMLIVGWSQT